jgi:DNA-binding protein H-NS
MKTMRKIVKFIILEVIASLLFIYIHFYLSRNIFTYGGFKMSERQGDSVVDWLEIDLGRLSGVERVTLINEIMDMLTAQELGQVRESADKKRSGKLKDARAAFISEMREKAGQLDLSFEEVLEMEGNKKTRKASSPRVKYRTAHGEWSGRGRVPVWLRELEAQGHKREDFLVKEE